MPTASRRSSQAAPTPTSTTSTPWIRRSRPIPDKLEKSVAVTLPYSVGIAVPKDKPEFRDAILAALIEIQSSGMEAAMLKKWSLDSGTLEAPHLLTD